MSKMLGVTVAIGLGLILVISSLVIAPGLRQSILPTDWKTSTKSGVIFYTYVPYIAKPICNGYTASLDFDPDKTLLIISDTLTVTAVLHNNGCSKLGLPTYLIRPQQIEHMVPISPTSQTHYLSILPDQKDTAEFSFMGTSKGQVVLTGVAAFEVHLNSGPPLLGNAVSTPITITIQPPYPLP